jgi:N utilization substance protein B
MANRHLSRSVLLQSLFEWDFRGREEGDVFDILKRNNDEYAPGNDDEDFLKNTFETFLRKKEIVDEIIQKAAPEWPLEKINTVDRNILRLGLTELLFGNHEEVPPKVVINESIELAKTFGGENSSKFVNGVLGAVYKEMGEPGKEQTSKKKQKDSDIENIDKESLPKEFKAGTLAYSIFEEDVYIALVHDVFGYWTLPRGDVEDGEDIKDTATRETKEKLGLDITPEEEVGKIEYIASDPKDGKILKQIIYFLSKSKYTPIILKSEGGLDDARWFALDEVLKLKIYDNITEIIIKSINILDKKYYAK